MRFNHIVLKISTVSMTSELPHYYLERLSPVRSHIPGSSLPLFFKGFLAPGEIDPLNRKFSTVPKPDVVVQGLLPELHLFSKWILGNGCYYGGC